LITRKSQFNVRETLDRLESILNEKGIKPVARVDHAAAAKSVDMELRPTQVLFFGNPKIGTQLMQSDQIAGLELPMRVLAWEDEDGDTWLAYNSPQSIVDRLNLQDVSNATGMMMAALNELTGYAIGE
jgi:uncharacterized protein (DUF302 family)